MASNSQDTRSGGTLAILIGLACLSGPAGAGGSQPIGDTAHLPDPDRPEIVRLLEGGDAGRALDRLIQVAPPDRPSADIADRVLHAALLDASARHVEAAGAWSAVATAETALADFAATRRIGALVRGGRLDAASSELSARISAGDVRSHVSLALELAGALAAAGSHEPAVSWFTRIIEAQRESPNTDRARLGLAASQRALGRPADALVTLRDARRRFRDPATYAEAHAAELAVAGELRRPLDAFSETDYQDLAGRLNRAARYADERELLEEWRRRHPATPRSDRIDLELMRSYYAERTNDQARAQAARFLERHAASPLAPSVHLTLFRLEVREGRTPDVKRRGYALLRGGGAADHETRYAAGTLLAAYLVSVGEVEAGLDVYRELFRLARGASSQRDVLWRAGVAAIRAGQLPRAVSNLRALMKRGPRGDLEHAGRYWLAVALERSGELHEALDAYVTLTIEQTHEYYGVLAERALSRLSADPAVASTIERVRRARSVPPTPFPPLTPSEAARQHPDVRAAGILARAGLSHDAAAFARRASAAVPGDKALAMLAIRASSAAGEHRRAVASMAAHFATFLERGGDGLPADFWGHAYPRPFWPEIQAAAQRFGIDPTLLVSLMRRESRFDPDARSAVGAIGLFQIMPYTAAAIAPTIGIPSPDERTLHEPAVNATFAAGLVRNLVALFGGSRAPLVASYNAGEDRAMAWWNATRELSDDFFVDLVPYSETRGFLREVLTNYEMYERLYPRTGR